MQRKNMIYFSDLVNEESKKEEEKPLSKGRTLNEKRNSIKTDGVEEEKYCCPRCGRADCPSISSFH